MSDAELQLEELYAISGIRVRTEEGDTVVSVHRYGLWVDVLRGRGVQLYATLEGHGIRLLVDHALAVRDGANE